MTAITCTRGILLGLVLWASALVAASISNAQTNFYCDCTGCYLFDGQQWIQVSAPPFTGIAATKLVLVDRGAGGAKAVFVGKDAAIDKGTGSDPATIGVTLDITYSNGTDPGSEGQFVAQSGSPNQLANGPTIAKYVNPGAPTDGATRLSLIKPGRLAKLVGKSLGDTPIDILNQAAAETGTARTAYCITNQSHGPCFCSTFDELHPEVVPPSGFEPAGRVFDSPRARYRISELRWLPSR